jgi:GDP-mannose transporter
MSMFNVYRKDVSVICWSFRGERSEEPFVVHKNTHASSLFVSHSYNHLIDGDLNILLVVFQAVIAVLAVSFSKVVGWVEYPSFNIATAKQWAPVNIMFCAMLFTGMASLQHNSVPMVTIFKNITNIVVTAGDYYFFGSRVEGLVMAAFGIMLAGAIFAAKNDVSITFVGLFWMAMNCLATAGYILYMKFATKNVKLTKFGMVFYNNVLCTVFLLPCTLFNGEFMTFLNTPTIHTLDYFWKNTFAGFIGFFLNFASLNCVATTGPTTYAIVGSLNKIPTALLGWTLFDAVITPQTWLFIGVSMSGGFLYSYAKVREAKQAKKDSNT